jgi:hypothetical protein
MYRPGSRTVELIDEREDPMSTATLLRAFCIASSMAVTGASQANEEVVREDIQHAITLEGHHCPEVVEHTLQAVADYIVTCANGLRYRVRISEHGRLEVTNLDRSEPAADRQSLPHVEVVKLMLASVIHLAGGACEVVVAVTRVSPREHTVSCGNERRYRVETGSDGRVSVAGE